MYYDLENIKYAKKRVVTSLGAFKNFKKKIG